MRHLSQCFIYIMSKFKLDAASFCKMKCNHFYDVIQSHYQVKLHNIIMTSYALVSSKINLSGMKDEKLLLKVSFVKCVALLLCPLMNHAHRLQIIDIHSFIYADLITSISLVPFHR